MTTYSDIIKAARLKMLESEPIADLIGTDIGSDRMFPDKGQTAYIEGWIFPGETETGRPVRDPSGLGTSAITLNLRSPFTSPSMYNTLRFRQLQIFIFSDSTRMQVATAGGMPPALKDAEDRCSRIGNAIFKEFHDAANIDHEWPNETYIVSCVCSSDLTIRDVDERDGLVRGEMRFDIRYM